MFLCFFFFSSHAKWDLSSPTREWTLCPLHWKCRVLTTAPPRKSLLGLCLHCSPPCILSLDGGNAPLTNLNEKRQLSGGLEISEGLSNRKMCVGHQKNRGSGYIESEREEEEGRREGRKKRARERWRGREKCLEITWYCKRKHWNSDYGVGIEPDLIEYRFTFYRI